MGPAFTAKGRCAPWERAPSAAPGGWLCGGVCPRGGGCAEPGVQNWGSELWKEAGWVAFPWSPARVGSVTRSGSGRFPGLAGGGLAFGEGAVLQGAGGNVFRGVPRREWLAGSRQRPRPRPLSRHRRSCMRTSATRGRRPPSPPTRSRPSEGPCCTPPARRRTSRCPAHPRLRSRGPFVF